MSGTFRKKDATGLSHTSNATGFSEAGGSTEKTLTVSADVTLDKDIGGIEDVSATLTDDDSKLATSAAIRDYVESQLSSAGMTWTEVTDDVTEATVGSGYVCNKSGSMCAIGIPATGTASGRIGFIAKGATGFSATCAAGDTIQHFDAVSIGGGTIRSASPHTGAVLILQCTTTDSVWTVEHCVGQLEIETA